MHRQIMMPSIQSIYNYSLPDIKQLIARLSRKYRSALPKDHVDALLYRIGLIKSNIKPAEISQIVCKLPRDHPKQEEEGGSSSSVIIENLVRSVPLDKYSLVDALNLVKYGNISDDLVNELIESNIQGKLSVINFDKIKIESPKEFINLKWLLMDVCLSRKRRNVEEILNILKLHFVKDAVNPSEIVKLFCIFTKQVEKRVDTNEISQTGEMGEIVVEEPFEAHLMRVAVEYKETVSQLVEKLFSSRIVSNLSPVDILYSLEAVKNLLSDSEDPNRPLRPLLPRLFFRVKESLCLFSQSDILKFVDILDPFTFPGFRYDVLFQELQMRSHSLAKSKVLSAKLLIKLSSYAEFFGAEENQKVGEIFVTTVNHVLIEAIAGEGSTSKIKKDIDFSAAKSLLGACVELRTSFGEKMELQKLLHALLVVFQGEKEKIKFEDLKTILKIYAEFRVRDSHLVHIIKNCDWEAEGFIEHDKFEALVDAAKLSMPVCLEEVMERNVIGSFESNYGRQALAILGLNKKLPESLKPLNLRVKARTEEEKYYQSIYKVFLGEKVCMQDKLRVLTRSSGESIDLKFAVSSLRSVKVVEFTPTLIGIDLISLAEYLGESDAHEEREAQESTKDTCISFPTEQYFSDSTSQDFQSLVLIKLLCPSEVYYVSSNLKSQSMRDKLSSGSPLLTADASAHVQAVKNLLGYPVILLQGPVDTDKILSSISSLALE
jgi:hypothetical protein